MVPLGEDCPQEEDRVSIENTKWGKQVEKDQRGGREKVFHFLSLWSIHGIFFVMSVCCPSLLLEAKPQKQTSHHNNAVIVQERLFSPLERRFFLRVLLGLRRYFTHRQFHVLVMLQSRP